MKYIECKIPENVGYIIVLGDLHIGDRSFTKKSEERLQGYIDWVKERKNARVILNGDLVNCATRSSKTTPFDQNMPLMEQKEKVFNLFFGIKEQIICAIDGNHEQRLWDFSGESPTYSMCNRLYVPYAGASAAVRFIVGKQSYLVYTHHTTGGGGTVGSKINRVEKLRLLCGGCDIYAGSHNHMLGVAVEEMPYPDIKRKKISIQRVFLVDCGGFLEWDGSYAEKKQMNPMRLGAPRIRLDGKKKDIHISL